MSTKNSPLRSEDMREKNEKLILRYIHQSKGISQSQIVQLTGLKAPTVLRIFSILEDSGLIILQKKRPENEEPEKKGRKPVFYTVNPNARYIIGVEFWSQTAHVLIVDFAKKPVYSLNICLTEGQSADEVYSELCTLINQAIEESGINRKKILGIGVGAPGQVSMDTGEILNYRKIPGFSSYPLGERLKERFQVPIFVANNAGVIALSAYRQGVAKKSDALFTYFIRRGVGGAFIHRGKLFSVLGKTAFEVGHTIADIHGKECYCGSKGCLETYISESAILECIQNSGYHYSSLEEVEQRILEKDDSLEKTITLCTQHLAVSAKNILRLLSPDGFLVITRYKEISRILSKVITDMINSDFPESNVQVYSDAYSSLEAGFGACDLIFDDYLLIQ